MNTPLFITFDSREEFQFRYACVGIIIFFSVRPFRIVIGLLILHFLVCILLVFNLISSIIYY